MHKARIWFMYIWLGLGLRLQIGLVYAIPQKYLWHFLPRLIPDQYTRLWRCSNSLVWVRVRITVTIMASIRVS